MARILGVNGIHTWSWSKDSFTDKLLDTLAHQHDVVDVQYPRMWAMLAYFETAIKRRAMKIVQANESEDDILIAHSFGCLATIYAMRLGAKFDKVFFFAAAADEDTAIPDNFNQLFNIHSDGDRALTLGNLLPHHRFGGMGKTGYTGKNSKVVNVFAPSYDHGDYVHPANICRWSSAIGGVIRGETDTLQPVESLIIRPPKVLDGAKGLISKT